MTQHNKGGALMRMSSRTGLAETLPRVRIAQRVEVPTMRDSRPGHTPKFDEVDPEEGTEPDDTPGENPSGHSRRDQLGAA